MTSLTLVMSFENDVVLRLSRAIFPLFSDYLGRGTSVKVVADDSFVFKYLQSTRVCNIHTTARVRGS